jgi:GNAT superfamily N-acetyltransferase
MSRAIGKLDIVQVGRDQLRVAPWRGDRTIAQITPTSPRTPAVETIGRCVDVLAERGFQGALTSALTQAEQQPFCAAGFTVHERLHLLRHDLTALRDPRACLRADVRLRRGRRHDRDEVLAVDASAFSAFWRFDRRGLDDARRATPASRYRVADAGEVVGYAVTGRAGVVGYLQRLAVRPDHQRRGIGAALIMDALRWASRHGCATVLVNTQETNANALEVYEHLGFVREPEGLAVLERPLADHSRRLGPRA